MNHSFQLLQTLYSSAFGRYVKFKYRFDKAVQSGKFKKFSRRKQSSLISRLRKLFERLKSLKTQLRIAGAGAALSLSLSLNNSAVAQGGLFDKNDAANPLPAPFYVNHPRVAVVDIDGDGDMDSFVGNADGDIQFFRNDAPVGTMRRLVQVTGAGNPFNGINKGPHAAPAFADVDGDGDFDMLMGNGYGDTYFFRNTTVGSTLSFAEQTDSANPFDGITGTSSKYGTSLAIPVFADIDDDDVIDLFIGSSQRGDVFGTHEAVQYFENIGTSIAPNFVSNSHPIVDLDLFNAVALTFADIDEDGDLDLFAGQEHTAVRAFRNDGSSFTELTGAWDSGTRTGNPVGSDYFYHGSPVFADMDGDNDLDFLLGQSYLSASPDLQSINYSENIDGDFNLVEKNDLNISPFGGVDVMHDAAPVFVDLDGDGDLDAVIGSKYSTAGTGKTLHIYENDNGTFIADLVHALGFSLTNANANPVFVDIDGDNDLDLFTGGNIIRYFENTGSGFTLQSTLFPSLNGGNSSDLSICFIDIDGDGALDALIGNARTGQPKVLFFENLGDRFTPSFGNASTPPEPFDDTSLFEANPNFVAVDLNKDESLDIVVTETYNGGEFSRTRLFKNTGDGKFTEFQSPLITEIAPRSFVGFADYDGDGDLDAFAGSGNNFGQEQDGKVFYFENNNIDFEAEPGIVVYNAVSANSDDLNKYMRIDGLPTTASNKVIIFNRWGDRVFEVSNYNNADAAKRFEGKSDSGKELPAGTYFYKVDVKGKTYSGYLSLKR